MRQVAAVEKRPTPAAAAAAVAVRRRALQVPCLTRMMSQHKMRQAEQGLVLQIGQATTMSNHLLAVQSGSSCSRHGKHSHLYYQIQTTRR
jgi:hypothetical protein